MKEEGAGLNKVFNWIRKNYKAFAIWLNVLLLPLMYFIVYFTGGTEYVYAHLMYLPILIAGILLGAPYGVLAAVIAGILLGPLMPLNVESGQAQSLLNWSFRMFVFILIGGTAGIFSDIFRRKVDELNNIIWVNQETLIPNTLALKRLKAKAHKFTVTTVILGHRRYFLEIFGLENVNKIMFRTYKNLMNFLPEGSYVFQADADKLWCLINEENPEAVKMTLQNALDTDIIIKTANIYTEYYIGFGKYLPLEQIKTMKPFRITDNCARVAENNNIKIVSCTDNVDKPNFDSDLLSEFYKALKNNDTYLAYHPVIDNKTGEVFKLEALIRWMHPKRGLINPGDFIPLVENTQLIHPLMEWVLEKIIDKIKEFQDNSLNVRIFMNISAKNFYNQNLVYKVTKRLNEKHVDPKCIGFEITESVLLNNLDESQEMIKQLKNMGISIAIDDFGKGYSSLSYLSHFDIDFLKIDKNFIFRIDDPANIEVIKATINLAKQLKFKTVAEGVETKELLDKVKALGFDYSQGFYFCKPVPQDKIIEYYRSILLNLKKPEEKQ